MIPSEITKAYVNHDRIFRLESNYCGKSTSGYITGIWVNVTKSLLDIIFMEEGTGKTISVSENELYTKEQFNARLEQIGFGV